jgi:hypothetical protein
MFARLIAVVPMSCYNRGLSINRLDSSDGSPLEQPAESQEPSHADAQKRD